MKIAHRPRGMVTHFQSDSGLAGNHAYATLAQTVSGTSGNAFFSASATLATAALGAGSIVNIGVSNHAYTVISKSGTTLNVTPNLTQTYSAGTALKIDGIAAWGGVTGYGSSATQVTAANKPGYLPAYTNGLDTILFTMAAKAMTLATSTLADNLFATGGTILFVISADSAGASSAGRLVEKVNSGGTAIWNIITTAAGGGYYAIQFNYVTSGTAAVFDTNSVVLLNTPQLVSLYYDASTPAVAPVILVIGAAVGVTTTITPTGTATADTGGAYTFGNRAAGDRGYDGRMMEIRMWKRKLSDFELGRQAQYLARKWGFALFAGVVQAYGATTTTQYYGARSFLFAIPTILSGTYPLVIYLHGGTGTSTNFLTAIQPGVLMGATSIYAFPQATNNDGGSATWNEGSATPFNNAPDTSYINNLVDYITNTLAAGRVNTAKIFLCGHSNGAMLAYRLVIENPAKYAGMIALSGEAMVANPNTYTGKIRHYHGQDDTNVPLAGGVGPSGQTYTPVQANVQEFTLVNSGAGMVVSTDFFILPSPAEHTTLSLGTALALSPYSTTFAAIVNDFISA